MDELQWLCGGHDALWWMRYANLLSALDKLYISYLSQSEHLLVQECVHPFEVWPSSLSQHGLVSDAKANPC